MATKILECTIHFAVPVDRKRWSLIKPKITVWKCYGNSRKRVHNTRASSITHLRYAKWEDTVRIEYQYPMPDATLVFQLTDIFRRKLWQATVPMINITQGHRIHFPLISKEEGKTLGSLVLTLHLVDHTEDQPTTTNKKATDIHDEAEEMSSTLGAIIGVALACASCVDDDLLD